jgi:tetratricopeptide (TPR) repeat protein
MNIISCKNIIRFHSSNVMLRCLLFLAMMTFMGNASAENVVNGRNAEALYKKASACFSAHNFKDCEKLCAQVMMIEPNHADTLSLMGSILVEKREFVQAKVLFKRAYKIKPSYNFAFNIAEMDYIARSWKVAEKEFSSILELEEAKEDVKSLVRFKLMVVALQQEDLKSLELHHAFFKNAAMQRELDFYDLLLEIHNKKPTKNVAEVRWNNLSNKHQGSAAYIDSLLETYFSPDKQ